MALIDFYIRNQKLSKTGPKIVADSINYISCSFTFKTDDWNGMDKWVSFKKGEEGYNVNLVDDAIPKETGLNLGEGIWTVLVFGESENTRITTNTVTLTVEESAIPEGGPLPVIELTEAEQIAAKAQKALDAAEEIKTKAEEGDFNGKPGEPGKTPNIQIGEVLTLTAGEEATASITGTPEEPRLNLGIPQGEPGKNGEGGGSGAEVTVESIEEALGYVPANPATIPTKNSQLENDEEFVKQSDIEEYAQPKGNYALKSDIPTVPTKVSAFENDAGYAKKTELPSVPVQSVNGKTGAVNLTAEDVGAKPESYAPTYEDVGAEKAGAVAEHNVDPDSHNDIRIELTTLRNELEAFLDIDDPTLDQLSELIQKIQANAGTITELTNGKVNVSDIVNNLTTNVANKPLSAAQGVVLKGLVDSLAIVANNATTTANNAKNTADEAKSLATTADTNANAAKTTAQNASEKVDNLEERMDSGEFKGEQGPKGDPYKLTEADKAEIVRLVHESIGTPIFGTVDENNNIILTGNLPDGSYNIKYEMEDDDGEITTIDIGDLVIDTNTYYSVTKNLTNCTINNSATEVVKGESYSATITANGGYELKSVSVTMGGAAVSVTNGVINIASVTGNIVITAVAEEVKEPTNFAAPNDTNTSDWSIWCNNARVGSDCGYRSSTTQEVTNYIPVQKDDVVHWHDMDIFNQIMGFYKSDKSGFRAKNPADAITSGCITDSTTVTISTRDGQFTVADDSIAFIKFTLNRANWSGYDRNNVVINIERNGEYL